MVGERPLVLRECSVRLDDDASLMGEKKACENVVVVRDDDGGGCGGTLESVMRGEGLGGGRKAFEVVAMGR